MTKRSIAVILVLAASALPLRAAQADDLATLTALANGAAVEGYKGTDLQEPRPERVDKAVSSSGDPVALCGSLDRSQTIPFGTRCKTSKGKVYAQVSHDPDYPAWKGPDGLIWTVWLAKAERYSQAYNMCADNGASLPNRADFKSSEAAGVREVLTDMGNSYFWLSGQPADKENAYVFDATEGDVGELYKKMLNGVICVAAGKHFEFPAVRGNFPDCQRKFGTPLPAHKKQTVSPEVDHAQETIYYTGSTDGGATYAHPGRYCAGSLCIPSGAHIPE